MHSLNYDDVRMSCEMLILSIAEIRLAADDRDSFTRKWSTTRRRTSMDQFLLSTVDSIGHDGFLNSQTTW